MTDLQVLVSIIPDAPWHRQRLNNNPNFNDNIEAGEQIEYEDEEDFSTIIIENETLPIDWTFISENNIKTVCSLIKSNFPRDILIDDLDWEKISRNHHLPCNIVKEYPNFPWNFFAISRYNHNFDFSLLTIFPDEDWDFEALSYNENININIVKENLNLPWDLAVLSSNVGISWNDIVNNMELPWIRNYILSNPNLNWKIVVNNMDFILNNFEDEVQDEDQDQDKYKSFFESLSWNNFKSHPLLMKREKQKNAEIQHIKSMNKIYKILHIDNCLYTHIIMIVKNYLV
jgi:hypothetical protein